MQLLSTWAAPAILAMKKEGITSLGKLSNYHENEIMALHGMGKSTIQKLNEALIKAGLTFKTKP